MSDVTLNSAVRANLRTLQSTTDLMNRTEKRLSTGKEVNSALDNPSNFFTAQSLDRRAGDLTSLLDSVSNSVKTLEAADNGIKSITDVVEQLKATARQALQSPSAVTSKANITSSTITGLTESNLLGTGPVAATRTGTALGAGTTGATLVNAAGIAAANADTLVVNGRTITFQTATAGAAVAGDGIVDLDETIDELIAEINAGGASAPTASFDATTRMITLTAKNTGADIITSGLASPKFGLGVAGGVTTSPTTSTNPLAGDTLVFKDRNNVNKTVTLSATAGANNADTLDELNKWFATNNVDLEAKVDPNATGTGAQLKIETTNAYAFTTPISATGTGIGAGQGFTSGAFSAPTVSGAGLEARENFSKDYNDLLGQINALAKDASYNGVNLLNGDDLSVIFNEDASSKLDVKGVSYDFEGLGLSEITAENFYDSSKINKVLERIEATFQQLESQSSKFGSQLGIVETREDFTKSMVGTLEDGAYNLTAADTNVEAANLASLQTRQSLIVSALSISNQQEQSILQLLR